MAAKKLAFVIPALLCLGIVFGFSSQPYEQQTLIPLLQRHISVDRLSHLLPDLEFRYGRHLLSSKNMPYHFVEFVFRKCAHVFSYTMLGCSLFLALRIIDRWSGTFWPRIFGMAAGMAAAAALDEWNQTSVSMRTGQSIDVVLDVVGGIAGALVVIAAVKCKWGRFFQIRKGRSGWNV